MHFSDRLIAAIQKTNSVVCVGLDPRLNQIPGVIIQKVTQEHGHTFTAAAHAFLEFNKGVIDAVKDIAPIVKPQIAFYEQYGFQGLWAYEETCKYAKEQGLLVLADAKRNDIGSTAQAYSNAFLGEVDLFGEKVPSMDVDALTINAYLGFDGMKPFIEDCARLGKGIFSLVKTSNPSSGDLQDQLLDGEVGEGFGEDGRMRVYELMAHLLESWGSDVIGESGYSSIGAVVGATYPKQAQTLRKLLPKSFFLVPGYGAQGGGAEDVKPCFNKDGLGAIVNSSRGIIFAYEKAEGNKDGAHYADAARDAVIAMNADVNRVR